jgi:tetratricopeptide (TPR) repeat protein
MSNASPARTSAPSKGFVTTKQIIQAIIAAMQKGELEKAANFYSRCQEDIGFQLINLAPKDKRVKLNLAKMFFLAKDFMKSAMICESIEDYERAGMLYEKADDYILAAEMYSRVDKTEKAAEMFERAGKYNEAAGLFNKLKMYDRAAVNFERSVNHFLAGKLYFQLGNFNKSMDLLQKIDTADDQYLDAVTIIGDILISNGYEDLAVRKYETVTQTAGLSDRTIEIYYRLASLLAKKGKAPEAKDILSEVLNFDFNYSEAADLFKKVEKMIETGEKLEDEPEEDDEPEEIIELEEIEPLEGEQGRNAIVSVMEGFEFLKGTDLFEELSLAEMKMFFNICKIVNFAPGDIIIEQDKPGTGLYILKAGEISIFKLTDGEALHIVDLPPGAHVGEMSLIDDAPTSARVSAKTDCELFIITRDKFEKLLSSNDKIALKVYLVFIKTICDRLRSTSEELAECKGN